MYHRRVLLLVLHQFSDIAILLCSLAVTAWIGGKLGKPLDQTNGIVAGLSGLHLPVLIAASVLWHLSFRLFNLYEPKRFRRKLEECMDIIKATSLGSLLICAMIGLLGSQFFNSLVVIVFWLTAMVMTVAVRAAIRFLLTLVRSQGRNLRHIVVLGTNRRARAFAEKIRERRDMGYNVIGYVDDRSADKEGNPIKILCGISGFPEILERYVVDEVVIALPIQTFYIQIREIMAQCTEQGITVRFIVDKLFDLPNTKSRMEYLEDTPLFSLYMGPEENWAFVVKRVVDFILSAVFLVLLIPLFVLVGALIGLTSQGPVFFVQDRVGHNKRRFRMYKFRTMKKEAEILQEELEGLNEVEGPVFKINNDPRITKIGKILRKTSIDELPQLVNVLKGDMSLVGPRPLPLRDYKRFQKNWQKRRVSVKPGITGLWQVCGRNDLSFDQWIELDMEYIDHWSLFLDFKILMKTIPAVLSGKGAM